MPRIVRGALVQATWTGDKESMIQKHEAARPRGGRAGCPVHAVPGALLRPLLLPGPGPAVLQLHRADPGRTDDEADAGPRQARRAWCVVAPMYEEDEQASGIYYNTAAVIDADGNVPGQVPQDPHPARQGLLGEVLLPAGQPRLPGLRDGRRQGRRVHLLRPPLPGGRPGAGPERRRDRAHPERHVAAACRNTCGGSSRSATRSPTATTSGRSTGSASSRTWATTTSTARATSSIRAASSSATSAIAHDEELIVRDLDLDRITGGPPDVAVLPRPAAGRIRAISSGREFARDHPDIAGSAVWRRQPSRFVSARRRRRCSSGSRSSRSTRSSARSRSRAGRGGGFEYGWLFDSPRAVARAVPAADADGRGDRAAAPRDLRHEPGHARADASPPPRSRRSTRSPAAGWTSASGAAIRRGGCSASRRRRWRTLEEAIRVIRALVEARTVEYEGTELELPWTTGLDAAGLGRRLRADGAGDDRPHRRRLDPPARPTRT